MLKMSITVDIEELGISQKKLAVAVIAGVGVVGAWYVYKTQCGHSNDNITSQIYQEINKTNTILSENLTPELLLTLKNRKTSQGYTLNDLVIKGINHVKNKQHKEPGLVMGDEECYEVFRELIDPLLMKYYEVNNIRKVKLSCFSRCDWRKVKGGRVVDKRVLSCLISSSRNIAGYPFASAISNDNREEIAAIVVRVMTRLSCK